MIDFLSNNIIWIIIGVIILIMALVGYFAENSELGKNLMPKKKAKTPKIEKQNKKPQTFEEAIKQVDKNQSLSSAIYGNDENNLSLNNIQEISGNQENDAWSNNIDTNIEQPQEVIEANPDEWLNAPLDLNASSEESETTLEEKTDYLYNLPTTTVLPEVEGSEEYEGIEVLDVSDEYEDIEVLNVAEEDIEMNPVEDALAQYDNSNELLEDEKIEGTEENTSEINDIWK